MMREILLALILLLGVSAGAAAQAINLNAIKPIPNYQAQLPEASFEAQTSAVSDTSPSDKSLAYSIRLPAGWSRADNDKLLDGDADSGDMTQKNVLGRIARYYGSDGFGQPSRIEISALRLSYGISLHNWFINYLVSSGFTLQGMQQVSPTRIESLYVELEGDQSYIVRSVATQNGPHIAVVSYFMPEEDFNTRRAMQERVIDSFQFLNADPSPAEDTHSFAFFDIVHFDYPSSWLTDSPQVDTPSNMGVTVVSDDRVTAGVAGQIEVHILAVGGDITLAQKLQELRDQVAKVGVAIGTLNDTPTDFKTTPGITDKHIEVYDAKATSGQFLPQEFWLAVLTEKKNYYIITMLTPSRSSAFLPWARNTEAIRTVIESIHAGNN